MAAMTAAETTAAAQMCAAAKQGSMAGLSVDRRHGRLDGFRGSNVIFIVGENVIFICCSIVVARQSIEAIVVIQLIVVLKSTIFTILLIVMRKSIVVAIYLIVVVGEIVVLSIGPRVFAAVSWRRSISGSLELIRMLLTPSIELGRMVLCKLLEFSRMPLSQLTELVRMVIAPLGRLVRMTVGERRREARMVLCEGGCLTRVGVGETGRHLWMRVGELRGLRRMLLCQLSGLVGISGCPIGHVVRIRLHVLVCVQWMRIRPSWEDAWIVFPSFRRRSGDGGANEEECQNSEHYDYVIE